MIDDQWWIFSEGKSPFLHHDNLYPKDAKGLVEPWAYLLRTGRWFEYVPPPTGNWHTRWPKEVPPIYRAALLLLPKPRSNDHA